MKVIFKDVGEVLLSSREPFLFLLDKDSFFSAAEEHLPFFFYIDFGMLFCENRKQDCQSPNTLYRDEHTL